jgi:hypothetical protein
MGRIENLKASKAPPLTEVKGQSKPLDMNITPEISLMLGRYYKDISTTNFVRSHA